MTKRRDAFKLDVDSGEVLRFERRGVPREGLGRHDRRRIYDHRRDRPLDTPLHVHANEDELFYVLEGEHVFRCGDTEFHAGPGGVVFAPRGVPHAHRRVVPRVGRFLTLASPAGLEGFFRELAAAERAASSMPEAYAGVSRKYGVTWLNH